jgi:hypothetical protein
MNDREIEKCESRVGPNVMIPIPRFIEICYFVENYQGKQALGH